MLHNTVSPKSVKASKRVHWFMFRDTHVLFLHNWTWKNVSTLWKRLLNNHNILSSLVIRSVHLCSRTQTVYIRTDTGCRLSLHFLCKFSFCHFSTCCTKPSFYAILLSADLLIIKTKKLLPVGMQFIYWTIVVQFVSTYYMKRKVSFHNV